MRALITIILLLASVECHALGFNLSFDLGGGTPVRYEPITSTLSWSPASKDFGSQNTGTNTDQTFTLTCRAGGGDCEEITNSVTGTGYSINSTNCATAPFTLTAGNGCNAVVRFTPASAGTLTGTLKAAWTNQSDVTAALTGVGVATGASDNFDTNGATLGANWTTVTGAGVLRVVSGRAVVTTDGTPSLSYWSASNLTNDHCSSFVPTQLTSNQAGPMVRMQPGARSGYRIAANQIRRDDSGTTNNTAALSANSTVGAVMKLCAKGNVITAYKDGAAIGSMTDSTYTTGYAGLWSRYNDDFIDTWVGTVAP